MKVIIIAAPSSVIFDQALPLVSGLKEGHPNLETLCLFPNPGSIIGGRPGWTTIRMLEELGATAAYPITPLRWMPSDRLTLSGKFSRFVAKASRFSFPYLYPIGSGFSSVISVALLALSWLSRRKIPRQIQTLTNNADCVIWDATLIGNPYLKPLSYLLASVPSFSIGHGLGQITDPETTNQSWCAPESSISENITLLAISQQDIAHYKKVTGAPNEQVLFTGIYRHHPDWVRTMASSESQDEEEGHRNTLLLISRGFSSPEGYLPRERVVDYLQDIREVATKYKLRVVVKPHPKENNLRGYSEALESVMNGIEWEKSDSHLAILAKRAVFAVCFSSGSCLDMTAYGVPTIERLNLMGLPKYDIPSAIRDSTGAPVSQFRQNGHVVGSSTSKEFFQKVEEVFQNRSRVLGQLRKAYSRQFISPPMHPDAIAKLISERCVDK